MPTWLAITCAVCGLIGMAGGLIGWVVARQDRGADRAEALRKEIANVRDEIKEHELDDSRRYATSARLEAHERDVAGQIDDFTEAVTRLREKIAQLDGQAGVDPPPRRRR